MYTDRNTTPMGYHKFIHYFIIPLRIITAFFSITQAVTGIDFFIWVIQGSLLIITFVGMFSLSHAAWNALHIYITLAIIGDVFSCMAGGPLEETIFPFLISMVIHIVTLVYYSHRKLLFYPERKQDKTPLSEQRIPHTESSGPDSYEHTNILFETEAEKLEAVWDFLCSAHPEILESYFPGGPNQLYQGIRSILYLCSIPYEECTAKGYRKIASIYVDALILHSPDALQDKYGEQVWLRDIALKIMYFAKANQEDPSYGLPGTYRVPMKMDETTAEPEVICPACGRVLTPGSVFCSYCGSKVEKSRYCMKCGKELVPDAAFCSGCGAPVGAEER